METMQAIAARRSCRSYEGRAVEREKIEKIVAAGGQAPNAGSFQITVIQDKDFLAKINNAALESMRNSGNAFLMERAGLPGYQPLYGAPVLILLSALAGGYSPVNAACAATVMTVAATDLGLGSCYVVTPTLALDGRNKLSSQLDLEAGYVPLCGVLLGYAGPDGHPAPAKSEARVNYL